MGQQVGEQPVPQVLGPHQGGELHSHVVADNVHQILQELIRARVAITGLDRVEKPYKGGEEVPAVALELAAHQVRHRLEIGGEQMDEELLLVLEIHVEAAPGDVGRLNDFIDGSLGVGDPGKLRARGCEELLPFLCREIEKGGAGHCVTSI